MTQDEFNDKVLNCIELMQNRVDRVQRDVSYIGWGILGMCLGAFLGTVLAAAL